MKRPFNFLSAILSVSLPLTSAFADDKTTDGHGAGNGGVVFMCPDRIKLVDFWESEELRNTMKLGDPHASMESLSQEYVARFKFFDPNRSVKSQRFVETALSDLKALAQNPYASTELVRFTDAPLNSSLDSDEVNTPPGCQKAQAVTQKKPEIEGEKLLTIYRPIWDAMDNEMRVFTLFHEAQLNELIQLRTNEVVSTRPARLLNQFLGSEKLSKTKTMCDYMSALTQFKFFNNQIVYMYDGFVIDATQPMVCDSITRQPIFFIGNKKISLRSLEVGPLVVVLDVSNPTFDPKTLKWISANVDLSTVRSYSVPERLFTQNARINNEIYTYSKGYKIHQSMEGVLTVENLAITKNSRWVRGTADLTIYPDGTFKWKPTYYSGCEVKRLKTQRQGY
jgi:hypothetical protein